MEIIWGNLENAGEAVTIVLQSQPDEPLVVPRDTLTVNAPVAKSISSLNQFLEKNVGITTLQMLFEAVAAIDINDSRPVAQPIFEEKEVELVFESIAWINILTSMFLVRSQLEFEE